MANNYDEDLYENPFFTIVQKQFTALFNKAVAEKALVCIPKYSACEHQRVTEADVKDHILFPDTHSPDSEEEDASLYKTLTGKVVLIEDGKLNTKKGFEHQQSLRLLFEETFHNENDNSYRVLCIEHFINRLPVSRKDGTRKDDNPSSYSHCLDLLWNHSGGQKTRDNLDKMMAAFGDVYDNLEGENLRSIVDMASAHFTKAMQHLLRDSVVRRSVKHNQAYMDSLKVAVETYLMNAVHVRLFRVLTALVGSEDAEINKMTRNLASLQLQDLGIRKIFSQNIPPAKKELAGLNRYSTPLGRLFCVKRVVTALTRPLKQAGKTDNSTAMMTTDDFLPILIFLIIKSEIPNWMANLVYMRHFHLAKSSDDDEFGFYLASVEAALEHIKSGYISEDMKVNKPKREGWSFLELSPGHSDTSAGGSGAKVQECSNITDQFFQNVQEGNEPAVRMMLQKPQRATEEIHLKLCHPLCSCDRCEKILSASRSDSNLVTAYTRDNRGYTALHMAAYYGQGILIDLLIQSGSVVDATDYLGLSPLHLACQRGYQNVMLLLLHFGADVMSKDNEGNTPLHHCCVNGHEDCVKALMFYDGSVRRLQVNICNELGDTALHMAAKWGYETIVKILLENGANATIKNRKRQSPVHVAQNVKVQRLLQNSTEGLELLPIASSYVTVPAGKIKGTGSRTSSGSSRRRESLSVHSGDSEDLLPSRVETASLDEVQDKQLKNRKDKLFKAIVAGDIQLVKFYLGIKQGSGPGVPDDEDEEESSPDPGGSVGDMCHPLCQCHKCLSIQKAQVRAHQALSINVKTTSNYTPLHMAVLHGHDDMVVLFLEKGAHVNTQNHKNLTPLHISACLRKLLTMQLLLDSNAKPNLRDINGDTPLLICSASGFCEGVRLLLKRGADVNVINHRGNTALHEAASHSHISIVLELLEAGADPTIRNKLTKTAFNTARDAQIQKELQKAMQDWQEKHQKPLPETRPRNNSQRVVGKSQVSIQQLFAAFEEDDLKILRSLTSAIRGFDKKGKLKRTVTQDKSQTFLSSLACQQSIEHFDPSSLRHTKTNDTSDPMHVYSLASSSKYEVGRGENVEKEEGAVGSSAEDDTISFSGCRDTGTKRFVSQEAPGGSGSQSVAVFSRNPSCSVASDAEKSSSKIVSLFSSFDLSNELQESVTHNLQHSVLAAEESLPHGSEHQIYQDSHHQLTLQESQTQPDPHTLYPAETGMSDGLREASQCEEEGAREVHSTADDLVPVIEIGSEITPESNSKGEHSPVKVTDHVREIPGVSGTLSTSVSSEISDIFQAGSTSGCGTRIELPVNRARTASDVSDILESKSNTNSGCDSALLSSQISVSSEVSDIFESCDFRQDLK